MRQPFLAYFIFVMVLIPAIFFLPNFYLKDTVAVCLSTICVIKFSQKLSLFILSMIVIATTVVLPTLVLFWITKNSGLSPFEYLTPTNISNLLNIVGFLLPTCAVIVLVALARLRWRH